MGRFDNEEIEYLSDKLDRAVLILETILMENSFDYEEIEKFLKSID